MVALKSVRQARRNGDRILAVIVGSGVNHDRRTNGIIAPSATAQEAMIRQAVAAAGVEASTVGLVETHGTGTPVGDPIELSALHAVYRSGDQLCALGAIKGNTGHIGSASGAISLVKTVLALRVGTVPANLHCREWNPEITPNGSRLFIPTVSAPWPVTAGPHRAGVSSFGFNGSNAHVVLEQDPQAAVNRPPHALPSPRLFMVSASAPRALALSAGDLADWLQGAGAQADLTDVAYTLARRREHRASRLAVTATDRAELVERLRCVARGESAPGAVTDTVRGRGGRPVWVFPGQGAQWLGMGRTLLATQPEFAAMIDEVEPWVRAEAGFSVRAALTAETLVTGINRVLPVIFAIQVALAAAWRARGVRPAAVIGHSLGEATAAVVAGALSLADGVRAICRRAQLLRRISGRGAMASVKLPPEQVRQELATAGIDNVTIAVWTSPQRTVVSGDKTGVERLVEQWLQRRLVVRRVNIDVAAHCAQLDPVLADMDRSLSDLAPLGPPTIPIYSTVLDDPRGLPAFDGSYWVDNIRRPVRFSAAVAAAIADGHRVFTELSQHPVLTRAITETAEDAGCSVAALATLRCGQDEQEAMLAAVAAVHCAGVTVDWVSSHPAGALVDAPLPR